MTGEEDEEDEEGEEDDEEEEEQDSADDMQMFRDSRQGDLMLAEDDMLEEDQVYSSFLEPGNISGKLLYPP